ncbi:MAG: GNAT family N-acetyltransferase [Caldilineaceae bacterium]|nr:GNAT family N-acetyltransferase [Caldilineaceae bacterium]
MAFAIWWQGDLLPALSEINGFSAGIEDDAQLLARMAKLEVSEVERRLHEGHRPYVARIGNEPVAYGWVATQRAHIGELDVTIALPHADRYLWDFATLPAWRGRGIYPRLLQAILVSEPSYVKRFWIIAAPENHASSAGIQKAGFTSVAHLSFQRQGEPGLIATGSGERIVTAATLLQVPVLEGDPRLTLSPCWHCAIDARQDGRAVADALCWPEPADLMLASCQCA